MRRGSYPLVIVLVNDFTVMTKFRIIILFASSLVMMTSSETVNMTCSFVWTPDPCGDNCERKCTTDEECHNLDVTMKCVSGWCACKDNAPYVNRCLYGKSIGDGCIISDECSKAGGFCDGGVCACYDNTVEFKGECYKGYKAVIGRELLLDITDVTDLIFWVSDKDEPYEINLNGVEAEYCYNFNAPDTWSTVSQNEVSIWMKDVNGECALCSILFQPTTHINRIMTLGEQYEMGIWTYDQATDSFDELCMQVNGIMRVEPPLINVTRRSDTATQDIDFHPFSHHVELVNGFLGDGCSDDDDCKPLGSECVGDICQCDGNHVEINPNCCAPKVAGLGSSCSVYDQCSVANAVCSGRSTCECQSGYQENSGNCI